MKVLQIVKTTAGATWAFSQAEWLYDHGVDIVTILPTIDGGMAEKYKAKGMKIRQGDFTLPVTKPWKILKRAKALRTLIEVEKPDLIHCHFVTNIMMARLALRKSKIPRLFQVPGPLHLESFIFRKAELILAKGNDYWAGACKKTCDIYKQANIDPNRVFLAYYGGYGGKSCDAYQEGLNKLHTQYNMDANKPLIGMVSYFYKPKAHMLQTRGLKGHEDFIDAMAKVLQTHPEVMGIIIGDAWGNSGAYVEKVKQYAKDKCGDNILFPGFRTDMKDIYREINIAVHPSHSENLGGAAESLAAGVPTISTNVGGFPDIVIDGETGYTVPMKNPEALAQAIIKMLDNPEQAREMAQKGQANVREILDIETTSARILEIYKQIGE